MKRAVVSVTRGGLKTALMINEALTSDVYTLKKYCDREDILPISTGLKEFMGDVFSRYREIIMVMSCGIAVRSIAPYLESKLSDPAVVVLDEKGRHVISLLSGHVGGANELARSVAGITGGSAVITTASDSLGMESVDMIAKRYGLVMTDMDQVKKVTVAMVNGETVGLVADGRQGSLGPELVPMTWEEVLSSHPAGVIYIGNKENPWPMVPEMPAASLIVPNLVIGVGCRKGADPAHLRNAVRRLFREHNLSLSAAAEVATVDIKANEPAIIQLAENLSAALKIIGRDEIARVESKFSSSEFVKKTIGVGAVCEPAAFIASGEGKCLIPKTACNGITLCVYEKNTAQT